MAAFPTLSRDPVENGYQEGLESDPSIRSQSEDGLVISRARFTATKKQWTENYTYLTAADKTLLLDFQDEVMVGADTFTRTNPNDDVSYTVRLAEPIKFGLDFGDNDKLTATITFTEA